ncbi:MAG: hypothetical protein ACOC9O_03185 [Myxococcota bacterium]
MAMKLGEPVDARIPWVRRIQDLDEARATLAHGPQMKALRRAGEALGDAVREGAKAVAVRTLPLTSLLYPTKFAFNNACRVPAPYVVMQHRCLLVQVQAEGTIRNILFNPTDYETSRETPFFRKTIDRMGGDRVANLMVEQEPHVDVQLRQHGVAPEDIDVIAFDHFHTQDLRPLLGSPVPDAAGRSLPARFPNAVLLAPRVEWDDWDDLHPMQRAWFIEDGKRGVPDDRVVRFDADLRLGEGCLLLRTPGHTTGNQTLFVHGREGVFGCSENGTSADNWAPYESTIPGLRQYARQYEVEIVLNSNTPEMGAIQYNSMILEKSVVDRVPHAPAFVQMFPSSEVQHTRTVAPGVKPAVRFGNRDHGTVQTRKPISRGEAAAAE